MILLRRIPTGGGSYLGPLTSLHTDHWLLSRANVMLLELGASKAWVEGPEAVGSPREARAMRPRVGPGPRSPGSVAWWRGGGNL